MPSRAWLFLGLAPLGSAFASASSQPLPDVVVEADAKGRWAPPPGAGPAMDSLLHPAWTRQNLWRPWVQWKDRTPAFDSTMTEAALVMATGIRRYLTDEVPDIYRENPDGSPKPFDPGHPFFHVLKLLREKGIRPVIDIGPPPEALCGAPGKGPRKGAFDFHVEAPRDSAAYGKYYRYIRDLFRHLQGPGMFSLAELDRWRYQLGREQDNRDAFDPAGEGKHMDPRNLEEYKKLYDHTLAGMRDAGVSAPLDFGNLAVAHDGVYGHTGTWAAPLMDWLASDAPPRCPQLKLPRYRRGVDTLCFSFSAYGLSQMSLDPRDLGPMVRTVRGLALKRFPGQPVTITVGEGNIHYDDDSHRGDGTELGGAWNAAILKVAQDEGLHRYQQWGFTSAPHISLFEEHEGLKPPAHNVIRLYKMMEGGRLIPAAAKPSNALPSGSYVDALAVRRPKGEVMVLAFHFSTDREAKGSKKALLRIAGLPSKGRFRVEQWRVDRDRGNYYHAWLKDNGGRPLARGRYDALMEYQFSPEQRAIWDRNLARYRAASAFAPDSLPEPRLAADGKGVLTHRVNLPPNSVVLLRIRPE